VEYPNNLDLALSVVQLGKTSVTYEIGVFEARGDGKDNDKEQVCAVGSFVHVFVDSKSRRPKVMESQLRMGLERLMRRPEDTGGDGKDGKGRKAKL